MVDDLTLPTPTPVGDEWGAVLNAGIRAVNADVEALQQAFSDYQGSVTTTLAGKVSTARQVASGTGLTGGGDLTADRTLAVDFAADGVSSASKAVRANDSRLSDARTPLGHVHTRSQITDFAHTHTTADVTGLDTTLSGLTPTTRTLTAGSGLTGGGDLSANRSFAVSWATSAPPALALTGAIGSAARAAREDHTHAAPSYAAFTTTWSASTTQPSLGNGTLVARFVQVGKDVRGYINLTLGTTSNIGAGAYQFTLPVAAAAGEYTVGHGHILDAGVRHYDVSMKLATSTVVDLLHNGGASAVQQTSPITLGSGDRISLTFRYEAA